MKIILVIPTYNESENLPILFEALKGLNLPGLQLLIVDDNSPDGCGELADQLHTQHSDFIQVLHRKEKNGLGRAYIEGFKWALAQGADVIGMMDADLSHPPEKLPEMLAALEDADIVIGSRYVTGGSLDRDWPLMRKLLSGFGNLYARTILNLPIMDTTGAYKLWRRSALESIPFENMLSNGYVFNVELAYMATRKGCRFKEVPIHFKEREYGASKMSFKIQVEAAYKVWLLRKQYKHLA